MQPVVVDHPLKRERCGKHNERDQQRISKDTNSQNNLLIERDEECFFQSSARNASSGLDLDVTVHKEQSELFTHGVLFFLK